MDLTWPRCACGISADIVCVRTFEPSRSFFCCRFHAEEPTSAFYWFSIAGHPDKGDPSLWESGFQSHLGEKTWGPSFLRWLFESFDLSPHGELRARSADSARFGHA